jgi:hypothetical protein
MTPEERLAREQKEQYERIAYKIAIGGVILCPTVALLPPRKLDLYTFSLGVGFYISANHLYQTSHDGRPLVYALSFRNMSLPTEKAQETSRILQEKQAAERARREDLEGLGQGKKKEKGLLGRLWMGDEEEGWKERRMEEERKAMAEGKSYSDMIIEQIWEVWNWDKKKGGEENAGQENEKGEKKK